MEFFTIGVYNSTEQQFFDKISSHQIDLFCDIRQRRGVRGAKYAFVNKTRLMERLESLGIKYRHESALAPPKEIRELQKQADAMNGEAKRDRLKLGPVFVSEYQERILSNFSFQAFFNDLEQMGAERIALFCVEEQPEACHRSLVTEEIAKSGFKVNHL